MSDETWACDRCGVVAPVGVGHFCGLTRDVLTMLARLDRLGPVRRRLVWRVPERVRIRWLRATLTRPARPR